MTFRTRWVALAAAGLALVALPGCGDDDDDTTPTQAPTQAVTATATTTASATATTTASATADGSPSATPTTGQSSRAAELARSPQYFIYVAGEGDTVESVADAFDANPDPASAEFVQRIMDENGLTSGDLQPGQEIAIPVILPGDLAMFAENSIEDALAVGQPQSGGLLLLQPSLAMREGFLGRLVLHRVQLTTGTPAGEGYGYVMEYWTADRPPMKGGEVDPEARVSDRAFVVAAGSLAGEITGTGSDVYRWERGGVQYALQAFTDVRTAQQLAEMLQTAAER